MQRAQLFDDVHFESTNTHTQVEAVFLAELSFVHLSHELSNYEKMF